MAASGCCDVIVDFHNHFLPRTFPALPEGIVEPAWPAMTPQADGGAAMTLGGRPFRSFDALYWDVGKRIAAMDRDGTDVQVISPLPEILSYWIDPAAGAVLCRATNAACAAMVAEAPTRLRGLAILPLQDVDAALREIEVVGRTAGLVGLFVGSNVNGVSIAAECFDPVFAAAERLGLIVLVHGVRPGGLERVEGPPLMAAVTGIPHETGQAVVSFMMRDVLARFPALKLVFSHGGGTFGAFLDRMELIWNEYPSMRETLTISPAAYARRFWYDTVVFGADYLAFLAARFGADRLLAGTDGPTEIGQKDVAGFIASAGIGEADRAGICGRHGTALLDSASESRRLAAGELSARLGLVPAGDSRNTTWPRQQSS